jgi:hypothetical protein
MERRNGQQIVRGFLQNFAERINRRELSAERIGFLKCQRAGTHLDLVAFLQLEVGVGLDSLAVDESAVAAAQIAQNCFGLGFQHQRVHARHARVIQDDVVFQFTPDGNFGTTDFEGKVLVSGSLDVKIRHTQNSYSRPTSAI